MNAKVSIARLSIVSNTLLIIMKVAVGLISGSVSIISEAIHSAMDLIAAIIAFLSVRISDNPPDSRHPYGHGKVENISGVIEALLIFIAAAWILGWQGALPLLPVFGLNFDLSWLGYILAAIYLVWLLNLYNFMDGIDGIAAIEAVTVCLGGSVLYTLTPIGDSERLLPLLLLAVVVGFLPWNFPKAKIFMGDVGSGFIGLMLGILSIQSALVIPELFWGWIILLGTFVVDATITLMRRIVRGQMFFIAHRSHAYQYFSRKLKAHWIVTVIYGSINLVWLLPISILVVLGWVDGIVGTMIAYLPLIFLAFYLKAGANELQNV